MLNANRIFQEYQARLPQEIAGRHYSINFFSDLLLWSDYLEGGEKGLLPSFPSSEIKKSLLQKIGRGNLYKTFQRSENARARFLSYLCDVCEDHRKISEFHSRFQYLWEKNQPKAKQKLLTHGGLEKLIDQCNFEEAKNQMLEAAQGWYQHGYYGEKGVEEQSRRFIDSVEGWSPKSSEQSMEDMQSQAAFSKILQKIFGDKTPERADEISWGLEKGIWRDYGDDFLQMLEQLEDKKEIKDLVQKLGREPSDETGDPIEGFKIIAAQEQPLELDRLDLPPAGYRGYEYGRDVSRLAPSALMLLADRETEFLFDVKFAKGTLPLLKQRRVISELQAQDGGAMQKRIIDPHAQKEPAQRGPIVALLDTSGSMDGDISKAVLLVMTLMAYAEQRAVFVVNFSSYHDIETIACNLAPNGIKKFMEFLRHSFGGGTEPLPALEKALEKVGETESWHKADLVMLSDGVFGGHEDMQKKLKQSAELYGTRLFGVCIQGNRNSFEELCDKDKIIEF